MTAMKGSVMWQHALQAFLVLAVIVSALGLRYALIDRNSDSLKAHRIYLLQNSSTKIVRQRINRWTWLAVLLVATSGWAICNEHTQPPFYPYGRFTVAQPKAAAMSSTIRPTTHYVSYGRFSVSMPEGITR